MKIKIIENSLNNINFFPFWNEDKNISSAIPGNIVEKVNSIKKYFKSKDQTKRFFIDDKDINLIHIGSKKEITIETIRQFASVVYNIAKSEIYRSLDVFLYPNKWDLETNDVISAFYEGLVLSSYKYKGFKSNNKNEHKIEEINMVIKNTTLDIKKIKDRIDIISESVFITRDLVNGPANIVHIDHIEKTVDKIAKKNGLEINILKRNELKKKGMNLILAVGEGGKYPPRLIELKYTAGKKAKTVCLIGKGIIFDTGGLNIKTGSYMDDMKSDMSGVATVIGVMNAAVRLKLPVNLIAYLPLAENSVDSNSFRPSDVIVAYNKKSVEIKNTDAEGRLVLADALSYSDKNKPYLTMDFATLTGAAVVALGTKITAGFFRDEKTRKMIMDSSKRTGEVIWELPLFNDYKEYLKNDIADISNLGSPPREAGTIVASLFLSEFVENKNWVHFDIAGPAFVNKEFYYNPKGATGVLVRTIVDFLENI